MQDPMGGMGAQAPSTPMTGPSKRRLGQPPQNTMGMASMPGADMEPVTQPEGQIDPTGGYIPPARPETLEEEANPLNAFSVAIARRRLSPSFGRRRL